MPCLPPATPHPSCSRSRPGQARAPPPPGPAPRLPWHSMWRRGRPHRPGDPGLTPRVHPGRPHTPHLGSGRSQQLTLQLEQGHLLWGRLRGQVGHLLGRRNCAGRTGKEQRARSPPRPQQGGPPGELSALLVLNPGFAFSGLSRPRALMATAPRPAPCPDWARLPCPASQHGRRPRRVWPRSPCSFRRWKWGDPRKLFLMELSRVLQGTPPTLGLDGGVGLGVPAGLSLGVCTGVPLGVGRGLPLGEG